MTGLPPSGPASAYATWRRPAATCLSGPNDVWAPGVIAGMLDALALPACAVTEPMSPSWTAAMLIATVRTK